MAIVKNSLTKNQKEKGIVEFEVNGEVVKLSPTLIRNYLVNGNGDITNQEINFFISLCKGRKLNPYLKEVHLIKYGSQPAQMVVGKDALLKRAILHTQYNGMKSGVWVVNVNGEVEKREGSIVFKKEEELIGAWCEVYRKDWENPTSIDVNLDEYIGKKKDGTVNSMWLGKPVTMIVKVAKAQALRETFVEELSGLYEAEELGLEQEIEDNKNTVQQDFVENVEEVEVVEKEEEGIF